MTALLIVNVCANALFIALVWFGVSGGLRRLIDRSCERDRLYAIPRKVTKKMIAEGGALDIAMGFIEESTQIHRYLKGEYDVADFFEWEFRLADYVDNLPLYRALLTALCCKGEHLKHVKKHPHYLLLEGVDFRLACGLVRYLSQECKR